MEEPIYVIKGSAGYKSAMSRTYTALLAHGIICVSLCERLKLSQECSTVQLEGKYGANTVQLCL